MRNESPCQPIHKTFYRIGIVGLKLGLYGHKLTCFDPASKDPGPCCLGKLDQAFSEGAFHFRRQIEIRHAPVHSYDELW